MRQKPPVCLQWGHGDVPWMPILEEPQRDLKHMSPTESSQRGSAAAPAFCYGILGKANPVTAHEWLPGEVVFTFSASTWGTG